MSAADYDVVRALGRRFNEEDRLRARIAELEAALKVLPLENGHTYGCQCYSWPCATRRRALEKQ